MHSLTDISLDLHELLKTVHHVRKMEKGSLLFQEGAPAEELYIIKRGMLQLSKSIPDGRELTLRICSEGDLAGEANLFMPSSKYYLSAKVTESGEVAVILKEHLEEQLSKDHDLAVEFMRWMSIQHLKTQTKFRDLVLHGKKGALYSILIRLSNSYGREVEDGIILDLPLTNQELANFCGTSREVVNRLLSDLRRSGIISVKKGIITIHELDTLKTEIDCENCSKDICCIE